MTNSVAPDDLHCLHMRLCWSAGLKRVKPFFGQDWQFRNATAFSAFCPVIAFKQKLRKKAT